MKNIIKSTFTSRLMLFSAALSFIMVTGCKDEWDEHYDADAAGLTYDGDMMSYISSNSQLSEFAEVVKASGFANDMASSQVRTLWAPANGSFDKDSLLSLIEAGGKESVIKGFIKNHMTRYSVSFNSLNEAKSVLLLNSKIITMSPDGTFGSAKITKANVSCKNGVVHVIDKAQAYQTNLYEQIEAAHFAWLAEHPDQIGNDSLISLYTFLKKYNDDSLDVNRSVYRGVDENGNRIYVDSVVIRNNTVLNGLDALIYTEDSNYYAIIPSVEAYQERVAEARKFLVYNPYENITDSKMCDSLQYYNANVFAMTDLFFNVNTNTRHDKLVEDSIVSCHYKKSNWENHVYYWPYQEGGLFDGANKVQCSNGTAFMMDDYPLSTQDQFFKKIDTRCTVTSNIDQTTNEKGAILYTKNAGDFPVYTLTVNTREHDISCSYLDVVPTPASLNPSIAFKIKNTLKATYDIYLVYCPIWVSQYANYEAAAEAHEVYKETTEDPLRPYYFKVNVYERNNTGTNIGSYPTSGTSIKTPDGGAIFTSNVENYVDTMYIGSYTTKNAYYNTTSEGMLIQFSSNITSKNLKYYSREMYLCKVILKPRLDEESVQSRKR